jgi:hypothetical protein
MIVRVQLAVAQAGLVIAFWLVCALQTAPAQSLSAMTPECRRVKTPDIVIEVAQRTLDSMRPIAARQGNVGKAVPAAINVILVDDALQSEVDSAGCRHSSARAITPDTLLRLPIEHPGKASGELDRWSVRGICAAAASEIRCSATAIELMLAKDESSSFSPTLQYVLGHEVAHIVLGHSAASLASTAQSTSAPSRLAAALDVCSNEADAVEREDAADELALELLKQELSPVPLGMIEPSMALGPYIVGCCGPLVNQAVFSAAGHSANTFGQAWTAGNCQRITAAILAYCAG